MVAVDRVRIRRVTHRVTVVISFGFCACRGTPEELEINLAPAAEQDPLFPWVVEPPCGRGFALSNRAAGADSWFGTDDPPGRGEPQAIRQRAADAADSGLVWGIVVAPNNAGALNIYNLKPPLNLLSLELDARGPTRENLKENALDWVLERAGGRETGGVFDDVWFQLRPASDTTLALEYAPHAIADAGPAAAPLRLSVALEPMAASAEQLWQLVPLSLCDTAARTTSD